MEDRVKYGQPFATKKHLLEWLETEGDKIDWDEGIWLEWYYKKEEEE